MIYYLEHAYHGVEAQIAAIGTVSHQNLAEAETRILRAEAALEALLGKMHFIDDAQDYAKYYFLLARNVFLLEDAKAAYEDCVAEAQRGVAVSLTASHSEMSAGERVTLAYTVRNTGEAAATFAYTMTYPKLHALAHEDGAPVAGEIALAAGESRTLDFVLTAREGGLLRVGVQLKAADGETLSDRVQDVQILGAGCYHGTTHSHSTESDGKGTLAQNFHRMIRDGMTLTYTADHNARMQDTSGFDRALESMRACGYRFAAVKGCEITVYGNNGHLLSYGNRLTFAEPPRNRAPETIANWNRIIGEIRDAGGYSYMAHPFHVWFNFTGFASDCDAVEKRFEVTLNEDILDLYTDMDGMEIVNSRYVSKEMNNDYAIAYWDRMNCKGYKKYFGSGGSDGHGLAQLSSVYNGFLLEELSAEAIEDAYRHGRQFVTTGPQLRFRLGGRTFGETLVTDSPTAELALEAYVKDGCVREVVLYDYAINAADPDRAFREGVQTVLYADEGRGQDHIAVSRSIAVCPNHFYRVVVRTDDAERVAFSNPVWVCAANAQAATAK